MNLITVMAVVVAGLAVAFVGGHLTRIVARGVLELARLTVESLPTIGKNLGATALALSVGILIWQQLYPILAVEMTLVLATGLALHFYQKQHGELPWAGFWRQLTGQLVRPLGVNENLPAATEPISSVAQPDSGPVVPRYDWNAAMREIHAEGESQ